MSGTQDNILSLDIPTEDLDLAMLFKDLEQNKETLGIQDYSVSQTTLEQIFLDMNE